MYTASQTLSRPHALPIYAGMVGGQGIGAGGDAAAIDAGLAQIAGEFAAGGVPVDLALEDIHMTVESRLKALVGDAAGRLHTARSRNDQVATDFRLRVRTACDRIDAGLQALPTALLARPDAHADSITPGFPQPPASRRSPGNSRRAACPSTSRSRIST